MSINQPYRPEPDDGRPAAPGQAAWDGPGAGRSPQPLPTGPGRSADGHLAPMAIPVPPGQAGPNGPGVVRIGLWGAPRSGKTTFLCALPIAAMQYAEHGKGNWIIGGLTPQASRFLSSSVPMLAVDGGFPPPTQAPESMSWSFQGEEPRRFGRPREVGFVLDLHDVSGEFYEPGHPQHATVIDQLATAHALVYLFDPLLDGEAETRSLNFFFATLNELNSRIRDQRGLRGNRLPHHVAVCVTKFDDPEVFRPSVEARWVTQEDVGARIPRVPQELGAGYFDWICNTYRGSSARLVRNGLSNYFHPERVSYYATSAIGFRLNADGIFDYRSYASVEQVGGAAHIVASPRPINVLEPLIDLERRITADQGRTWGRRR
ncbi:hypothetical protein ACIA8O_22505 [Kitasatospora sp. NPDC051853]|uniref:hypothetical protein n=1 Tax=Kitasatospora sp. NPDC051853 TaxID=3364058 RepID=UPI0037B2B196